MYFPHGVTVYRLPYLAGTADRYSNATDSWGAEQPVAGCAFDPGGSQEPFQSGRDAVVSSPRIFDPNLTAWSPYDRVRVGDRTYSVQGDPSLWQNPFTGWAPAVEVRLEAVDG